MAKAPAPLPVDPRSVTDPDPGPDATAAPPPATVEAVLARISEAYESLSRQLKLIARHVEQHRDHLGLEGIQDVARHCGVQPSAVVRFAKHFGFSGYTELQRIFRDGLSQQIAPNRNYQARIREAIDSGAGGLLPGQIAQEFLRGSVAGMQELSQSLDEAAFAAAVDLLAQAPTVWIAGSRRSFPVAVYLDYALQHTDKRIMLVHALGSMHEGQMRSVQPGDVMVAITFSPYAEETVRVTQQAAERGARVILLTDSRMSPLAREAVATLIVQDSATFGFRALTGTMALAQSLFIALAYRLELPYRPTTEVARQAPAVAVRGAGPGPGPGAGPAQPRSDAVSGASR